MNHKWEGMITFLGTQHLEETHQFYHEMLGLPLYKDQGVCRIYDIASGGKIGFCSHIKITAEEKSPIITLLTDEVDQVYDRLLEAGIKVQEPPKENPKFHIYHFFLKDPNGYTVEIQKFLN